MRLIFSFPHLSITGWNIWGEGATGIPSFVHKLQKREWNVDLKDGTSVCFSSCLFPPRLCGGTKYIFFERNQEKTFFFFFWRKWFSSVSLPFCSYGLLVMSPLLVTPEMLAVLPETRDSPLESFWHKNQDIFGGGIESLRVRCPSLGWVQGKDELVSVSLDEWMVMKRRPDRESEVTAAEVNETRTYEYSVCFWNLARPLGEAQEES